MKFSKTKGALTLQILLFGAIAVILLSGFLIWADMIVKSILRYSERALAFTIAEAGVEYYRWHLAHNATDYTDGTGQPGPYTHDYFNKDNDKIGEFILDITPPISGSTIVTIKSTGKVVSDSSIEKIVEVKMGIPSLAKYAVAANADIRFGEGTEVFGVLHSNGGIRFDGLAHNLVTSAKSQYNDPDHSGGDEFGVHTHVNPIDPEPPAAVPNRIDVFEVGREFPVSAVDFAGFTADLAQLKTDAQTNGLYFGATNEQGYHIVLKTNDTFDIYRVTAQTPRPNPGCNNSGGEQYWDTWSVQGQTFIANYAFPQNNIIFAEDNVWIEGQINTARLMIAAARFPETSGNNKHIIINNDLLYTNYDGQDVIALFSQGNISAGLVSDNDLRVDAALIAKNERVGRNYYRQGVSYCGTEALRNSITLYGMLATNKRYGFSWSCGGVYCSGYQYRYIIFDANLLYGPPPGFPLTSNAYEIISWEEIK